MDFFSNIAMGFDVALSWQNLIYAFLGCLLGTLIGVLPGVGPVATIAMLLPVTYGLEPVSALIMLAGIYYGAQYGGSTTAILVNLPGESSSVVTMLDGHQMARKGRAGPALAAAGIGSFMAGCIGTLILGIFAKPLTELAFLFGTAEYFSLMVLGLVGAVALSSGNMTTAVATIFLGMLIGTIGMDVTSGVVRYSLGFPELSDGIDFVVVAMGMFGLAEVMSNLSMGEERDLERSAISGLMPTTRDFKLMLPAIFRGTLLGAVLGVLPGGGALLASFAAYTLEKRSGVSQGEVAFGQGNIRGVAAPEAANNAGAQTSFIPLLTLGIPPNAVMALMVGAMAIHNIQPGPEVMNTNPELFWGLIASMWIGNAMLIILNLPLVGVWARLVTVPYRLLFPSIIVFCCFGVFTTNNSIFDVWLLGIFGLIGFVMYFLNLEPTPLLLGLILGPLMEEYLLRTLMLSEGDWSVLITRPGSGVLLGIAALLVCLTVVPKVKRKREEVFDV
ncbi:tripartite tricarboxylate transporter permease [Burkholderia dolosa]|uniref:tripartite tricarboxylate transporter permease n=1 Tax=Burkholderia dolosa TaxID=152500 RepID=UPI001B932979|nr:tripartite tricarboxylate transporter permease [Burkholderia dolosa]MBR8457096.1 tripartite tricarboxylate transporter permease [Burkholderia dolosa]MDN7419405.1 tripartite tricarboxylate transporter permease [Burkholderia dolosa]